MNSRTLSAALLASATAFGAMAQAPVAHFDMALTGGGQITELAGGRAYAVQSQLPATQATGLDGQALRFDGYSTYVRAALPTEGLSTSALTLTLTLAAEAYPMMRVEDAEAVATFATLCGNLNEAGKRGLALELSSQGDLRLRFGSASGFLLTVSGDHKLPLGRWVTLAATLDKAANKATLYLDGEAIGSGRMSRQDVAHATGDFWIGRGADELRSGPFLLNAFCGLIDDVALYGQALDVLPVPPADAPRPDFSYPAERYEASLWRPRYHAMPSGSWTNETHGMMRGDDGRWHVYFQKNPNGPYMARLHWGHISSANLYDWRDEPIALAPGEAYDIKGCWSGCIYRDGAVPTLLYTAVDNVRATIASATTADAGQATWQKQGIAIDGRPSGLSDDFRDPYWFEADGRQYVIVGTSKNGIGACTLHRLEGGRWTNDGSIFYQGGSAREHGTFWEMPNVTPMADGRWLFTCTPLGTAVGVRTLCWTGTIRPDGTFAPDGSGVQYLEMGGLSRDGYGLLSPTIARDGDETLLLGIVPDKLATHYNHEMGWAHTYSLPRELAVDAEGLIAQRPYHGLTAMRTATTLRHEGTLDGTLSLAPVGGRQIELLADYTIGTAQVGLRFLASGSKGATLTYSPADGSLTLDLTGLERVVNDAPAYSGIYRATLPQRPTAGERLRLHVYVDGSIADIFVQEKWAFSVRMFPTSAGQVEAEAFAMGTTQATVSAWTLAPTTDHGSAIETVTSDRAGATPSPVAYDLMGRPVGREQDGQIYIRAGHRYIVRR